DGNVWASPLTGRPGFAHALDPRTVQVDAPIPPGDPLADDLGPGAQVGLLIIDLAHRGRVRLNGVAVPQPDGTLRVQIEEAFGNCQKYIQARVIDADESGGTGGVAATRSASGASDDSLAAGIARATSLGRATQRFI